MIVDSGLDTCCMILYMYIKRLKRSYQDGVFTQQDERFKRVYRTEENLFLVVPFLALQV